ncbi:hypothetical protein OIU85_005455 [Salix viminalis]|uniref:Uncharacterized protein n=1 Tax=Salix viminalis TaxID=40686 RepID=A0A9Q0PJ49_SALVM|nr:hypothetical protein OIU85_005455 [Salix viminalis]
MVVSLRQNSIIEQEFKIMIEQHAIMLEKSNNELLEMNRQLGLEVSKGKQQEEELKAQLETQGSYQQLKEKNLKALGENRCLLQKVLDLKEEMHVLEEENGSILQEAVTVSKLSSVFESFAAEKVEELASHAWVSLIRLMKILGFTASAEL